jgi:r-opsin
MFSQDMNHRTFILSMTVAVTGLIILIIGCYFFIVRAVFDHEESLRAQAKKMNVASLRSTPDQQQLSAECRAAKVAILNVTLWIVAWSPFMIINMMGVWGDPSFINPVISELPILFAKTSCCWNPIIYALSHPKLKQVHKSIT